MSISWRMLQIGGDRPDVPGVIRLRRSADPDAFVVTVGHPGDDPEALSNWQLCYVIERA